MSSYIPSELSYRLEPKPDSSIVLDRHEVPRMTATALYSPTGSSVIRAEITGNSFVDLSSVKLYAALQAIVGGGATHGLPGAGTIGTKVDTPSTYELFSSMTITTGNGDVIERLSNADVLGRWFLNQMPPERKASHGSFENAQDTGYARNSCEDPTTFRIGALSMFGFLASGKYYRPSDCGGITIELQLQNDANMFQVKAAGHSAALQMSKVKLVYDQCTMSPGYLKAYEASYGSAGTALMFSTVQSHQVSVSTLQSQIVPFTSNTSRCKALVAVLRPSASINNKEANSTAATSAFGSISYQFDIGSGKLHPSQPIDSHVQAFTELEKFQKLHYNPQCAMMSLTQFSTDWTDTSATTQQNGKFSACVDLENFDSSSASGVRLDGACQLRLDSDVTDSHVVNVFVFRDTGMATDIMQKRIQINE